MDRAEGNAPGLSVVPAITNEDFLKSVFGKQFWYRAHVTGFDGDPGDPPPGAWGGGAASTWKLSPTQNNYFCVSLFTSGKRRKETFDKLMMLGVDDVGPKVSEAKVRDLLGEPTFRIETSPGNQQWGYVLETPIAVEPVATKLIEALIVALVGDAPDPGMGTVTRYLRLPVGVNQKPSAKNFRVRLLELGRRRVPWQELTRLALRLSVDVLSPASSSNVVPGPGATNTGRRSYDDLVQHDRWFAAMRRLDLVLDGPRNSAMGRCYDVICPWADEHTGRATSGTAYVPVLGRFECHHGHCADRTGEHLPARLNELLRQDSCGLVGLVDVEFDDLPSPIEAKEDLEAGPKFLLRDPASTASLPMRSWAAKHRLLRGAVTLLFGPPDQGKSLLLVRWAVNLALGRSFSGLVPGAACKVMAVFAEEDLDEQDRRIEAALLSEHAAHTDLAGRLQLFVCADLATMFLFNRSTRRLVETPLWHALVETLKQQQVDVLVLDPMVELHTAEENDNVQLKAVIGKLRSLARQHDIAVLLCHHSSKISRKEGQLAGNLDAVRGASAIGGAVRTAFSLVEMEETECRALGVSPELRRYYVRLDLARSSQAAPARVAEWYHKIGYRNANGDETATLEPWLPPQGVIVDDATLDALEADIGAGCATDHGVQPWSAALNDYPRSLKQLFQRHGLHDRATQEKTWRALQTERNVVNAPYRKTSNRRPGLGCRTTDGRPVVAWDAG